MAPSRRNLPRQVDSSLSNVVLGAAETGNVQLWGEGPGAGQDRGAGTGQLHGELVPPIPQL